ncbi:hypothetical protein WJX72_000482 [[Myrmecia] bisecta]|uniref:ATP synthase F1 complex delta/epsilon subunit N-terminal domain-containing protein n=1 Tax=[Myrmecia] bisecta TaxID=41462 RepID=A0AAW1P8V0_9CHLO
MRSPGEGFGADLASDHYWLAVSTSPPGGLRCISTTAVRQEEAVKGSREEFLEQFKKVAPSNLAPPRFIGDFVPKPAKVEGTAVPEKLTFNFYVPHDTVLNKSQVDLVLLPAVTGDFGVMPGHVPTVAQLRPGVVTVHKELDKDVQKYFVSSGFAFIHADSTTELCAVEAVKLDELDVDAVRSGLQEYNAKLAAVQAKGDDYEIAAAQIGVEVYSALNSAVGG